MRKLARILLAALVPIMGCARSSPNPPASPTVEARTQQSHENQLLDLIEGAIEAHGGDHRLERLKSGRVLLDMTLKPAATKLVVEEYLDLPRRYRRIITRQDGEKPASRMYLVVGSQGWTLGDDGKPNQFQAGRIENSFFSFLLDLEDIREQDYRLTPMSDMEIGGRPALGIQVNYDGEWVADVYLDKEKFLVLQTRKNTQPMIADKKWPVTTSYAEFKEFDGLRLPGKAIIKYADEECDVVLREVQWMPRVDDKIFAPP